MSTTVQAAAVSFLIGLVIIGWVCYSALLSFQSYSWNSARGKVTESRIKRSYSKDSSDQLIIRYQYQVKGKTHYSDRIHFGDFSMLFGMSKRSVVKRYPKGKSVDVYYNPDNPKQAVLEQDLKLSAYIGIVVGMFCCGFAFLGLFATGDFTLARA